MAGDITEIKAQARAEGGFFDKAGNIRSKEDLATAAQQAQQQSTKATEKVSISDQSVGQALQKVRTDVNQQVNDVAANLNVNKDSLREAKDINQEKRAILKDLKAAVKAGDEETSNELRTQFKDLSSRQDNLAKRVTAQNQDQDANRVFSIRVGNKEIGSGTIERVQLDKSQDFDLNSKQGIAEAEKALKQEKESIDTQLTQQKQTTDELKKTATDARSEIKAILDQSQTTESQAVDSFERAQKLTEDVVGALQSGANGLVNRLSQNNVQRLLQL